MTRGRILLALVLAVSVVGPLAAGAAPSVAGVLGVTSRGRLKLLDPRTLVPLRGAPSLRLGARLESATLSPDGTRAALALAHVVVIVDTRTLRVVERIPSEADASRGLFWLGDGLLVADGSATFGPTPWSWFSRDWTVFGHRYTVISSSATTVSASAASPNV